MPGLRIEWAEVIFSVDAPVQYGQNLRFYALLFNDLVWFLVGRSFARVEGRATLRGNF